jgi:hypothetical protein
MATVTVRYSSISRARARRLQELTEEGGDGVSSVAQGDPNGLRRVGRGLRLRDDEVEAQRQHEEPENDLYPSETGEV